MQLLKRVLRQNNIFLNERFAHSYIWLPIRQVKNIIATLSIDIS
jgi:hypothetical protein